MSNIELLKKHNFSFNKSFGQNFIFDTNLLDKIVDDAEINENTTVLEIGCGAGTLTKQIAKRAKRVVGYEIDNNLRPVLQDNLQEVNNAEIVFKDVMKETTADVEQRLNDDYVIIANLPYYITTPIIFKFLNEAKRLKRLVIMVQLEVAERLCAKENTSDYGAITVAIATRGNAKITRIVKKNMFVPAPKVDSAIVKIDFVDKYSIENKELLDKLIRSAFQMRRKTLLNNLKSAFHVDNVVLENILKELNISLSARGESLSPSQFVELANLLNKRI